MIKKVDTIMFTCVRCGRKNAWGDVCPECNHALSYNPSEGREPDSVERILNERAPASVAVTV